MKIVLVHPVSLSVVREDGSAFACLLKTIESGQRPIKGDLIEDPAFAAYSVDSEVVKVILDYAADTCYASLRPLVLESDDPEALNHYAAQAEACGWAQAPRPE